MAAPDQKSSTRVRQLLRLFILPTLTAVASISPPAYAQFTLPQNQLQSEGIEQQPQLRGLTPDDIKAKDSLEVVTDDSIRSQGTIFVDPGTVVVKPPLLSALITINKKLSPYELDAASQTDITLSDVLKTALEKNLPIKISQANVGVEKWQYVASLGGFLPNLTNEFGYQTISGTYASPAGLLVPIKSPFMSTNNSFTFYGYKGGSIVHGALESKHKYKAAQYELKGTTNDVLLDSTKGYYDLVLNEVLLQIRIKAVEVSNANFIVSKDQFDNGVNTQLDVLQAKYLLSKDRQDLIKQQIARRESAIALAAQLNLDTGVNLGVKDRSVTKIRLVDDSLTIADLLKIAVENRPELKHDDEIRRAALEAVKVARAALLPTVAASGAIIGTGARVSSTSLSSLTTPLSSSGTGIGSVSSASGLPLAGPAQGPVKFTPRALYEIGIDIQWNLGGMAVTEAAQVQSARYKARIAKLECQKELEKVYKQVRDAYLTSMSAESLIDETTDAVNAAEESVRIARIRLKEGVSTYVDLIEAHRHFVDSLIDKANAIIQFNNSQAKLLYAIGRLSSATLTSKLPLKQ